MCLGRTPYFSHTQIHQSEILASVMSATPLSRSLPTKSGLLSWSTAGVEVFAALQARSPSRAPHLRTRGPTFITLKSSHILLVCASCTLQTSKRILRVTITIIDS